MTREELHGLMIRKKSFLCVGLDSDISKLPKQLLDAEDPVFEFNRQIIDATIEFTIAYKPNLAFTKAAVLKAGKALKRLFNTWISSATRPAYRTGRYLPLPMPNVATLAILQNFMQNHFSGMMILH